MERIKPAFTTYQFNVDVVTPVHVGMAQEKHYMPGLDFVQKGSSLTFLNADGLFKALLPEQLDKVTADMAAGEFDRLNTYLGNLPVINDPDVRLREETVDTLNRTIREIRRAYVSGLGQPTLPGTSLKGAIRSVLVWHLTRHQMPQADNWGKLDETLFGPITANFMRYLQLSDVCFEQDALRVFPVKVFSGDGNPNVPGNTKGQWKHGRDDKARLNHHPEFMPESVQTRANEGFLNFFESLRPGQRSELRIGLATSLLNEWFAKRMQEDPFYRKPFEQLTGSELIRLIRDHTAQYLTKERQYYELFDNDDLNVNARRSMQERLQELERSNAATNSCLLRVGANVGFHSITGDWQDISRGHYQSWVRDNYVTVQNRRPNHYKERQRTTDHIFAKTRKFDVVTDPERDFLLPGFLKLTLVGDNRSEETRARTGRRMVSFGQAFSTDQQQKEQSRHKRLEAESRKYEPVYLNKVPRKGDKIDAVVVRTGTPTVQIELYITEQNKSIVSLRYPNLPVGQVITVLVKDATPKGVVNSVELSAFKNKP
ncbi:RAMP superfamily CRISPR-associated protein [Rudanella lutea]|uniref:RAMP superfamily CRISPR-associated protein n=1 Tax=Rudanella lutea TaxID=451374 RepID=UPI000360F74D|nr:RAMP superfamily CRISPR-associated protein [Rudanella lutea]